MAAPGATRRCNPALLRELDPLFCAGCIHPAAPRIYPLDRAGEALRDLMERRLVGKAALAIASP